MKTRGWPDGDNVMSKSFTKVVDKSRRSRHSLWRIRKLMKIHGIQCCWCGEDCNQFTVDEPYSATIEHLIPKSKGGTWELENLRIACKKCNQARGNDSGKSPWILLEHKKASDLCLRSQLLSDDKRQASTKRDAEAQ